MKFGYAYKKSDGTRLEDVFEAKSKEDVFASLRANGIKPIKVWEIHSRFYISRRTRLIVVLVLVSVVSVIYAVRMKRQVEQLGSNTAQTELPTAPRHQIYGDPALLEEMERGGFAMAFPAPGDRVLAAYAIPGKLCVGVLPLTRAAMAKALEESKDNDVVFSPDDSSEVTELKKIVQGMKDELRWYVGDGVGTVETYLNRLQERQEEEARIYERTVRELEASNDPKLRVERNAALRAMGLRTIPRPRQ